MEEEFGISISTGIEKRVCGLNNSTTDEAVAFAIVLFDKFAQKVGDFIKIYVVCKDAWKPIRKITLEEGMKINVEVL